MKCRQKRTTSLSSIAELQEYSNIRIIIRIKVVFILYSLMQFPAIKVGVNCLKNKLNCLIYWLNIILSEYESFGFNFL